MKRLLLCLVLILSVTLVLVACQPEEVQPVTSVDINTVEDFLNINTMVGEEYDNTNFNLKDNLTIAEYIPINSSLTNAFPGVFNGNNKTINLTISDIDESGNVGLFGCIKGAIIKDLTINIVLQSTVKLNLTTTSIGGVAGLSIGDCTVENVTVNLDVQATVSETVTVNQNTGKDVWECNNLQYVGGVVGTASGNLKIDNVLVNSINLKADSYLYSEATSYQNLYCDTVFAGGVIGSVAVGGNVEVLNTTVNNFIPSVSAKSAYIGGFVGDGSNVTIKDNSKVNLISPVVYVMKKGYVGGIAGYLYNSKIDGVNTTINCMLSQPGNPFYFNFGGLVGYMDGTLQPEYDNLSTIKNCKAIVTAYGMTNSSNNMYSAISYAVGYLKNTTEKAIETSGTIQYGNPLPTPETWGDKYGIMYGSSYVDSVTHISGTSIGIGKTENHIVYDEDGTKINTIKPSGTE